MIISGEDAFLLHSTYGFLIELTEELVKERGGIVDREAFDELMKIHKSKSGKTFSGNIFDVSPIQEVKKTFKPTNKVSDIQIKAIIKNNKLETSANMNDEIILILNETPFQVGDLGTISGLNFIFNLTKVKDVDGYCQHFGTVTWGRANVNDIITVSFDIKNRLAIRRANTASHIISSALCKFNDNYIISRKIEADSFQADVFSTNNINNINLIEEFVNEQIMNALPIEYKTISHEEAKQKKLIKFFGKKYKDNIRTMLLGDLEEICGDECHVANSSQIGYFKIIKEESIESGFIRRLTAIVGEKSLQWRQDQSKTVSLLGMKLEDLPKKITSLQNDIISLKRAIKEIK